jgi:hypothetical protein
MESGLIFKLSFVHVSGMQTLTLETRHNNSHRFEEISQFFVDDCNPTIIGLIKYIASQFHFAYKYAIKTVHKSNTKKLIKCQDGSRQDVQSHHNAMSRNFFSYPTNSIFPNIQLPISSLENSSWAQTTQVIQLLISLKRQSCSHIKNKFVTAMEISKPNDINLNLSMNKRPKRPKITLKNL